MLLLVIFGPLSLFYFLSKGEYHFTKLPYLYDETKNHKPVSYNRFSMTDQNGDTITQDYFKDKFAVINYMDATCPYDCNIDARIFKLIVYKELMDASGFKDVVIITEVNDSSAAHRKLIQESLEVDGNKWKFVYSKNFSFFDIQLNSTNPRITKSSEMDTRQIFNMTMEVMRHISKEHQLNNSVSKKIDQYFDEKIYQRSILIIDKSMRIRSYLNSSEDIEFKRVMEELRLLKKEYSKKKTVL